MCGLFLIPGSEDGRVDTGCSQNVTDSNVSSSSTEPGTKFQMPKRWWQLTTDVPTSPASVKESETSKDILKKKAMEASVPESTELAVENVARDVPKSGNDRNFDSSDLEEDLAAEQMVSSPGKSIRMHNDTLQALGQSMLDHIQVRLNILDQSSFVFFEDGSATFLCIDL
jgi:hypothetical protein